MPIRMEKDPQNEGRKQPKNPRQNQGSGGISKLIPFLLFFVFKKPKLLIPLLIVGGIWYFFFGGAEMFSSSVEDAPAEASFSFGATLNEAEYDLAQVFEPLSAYNASQNRLPSKITLERYAPKRMHQGRQGSCVGWASSYAARTILQAQATGQNPNNTSFSPAYLYNQIALPNCQGAYMRAAMENMRDKGVLPFSKFSYTDRSCGAKPDAKERQEALAYRIKGFHRLTLGARNYKPDMQGIKQHLAQGAPVVIGMQVGGTFMHQMRGKNVWRPTQRDYGLHGFSGHAMCVLGYDDTKAGGAFQIMNSWGPDWGNNGMTWVSYQDFEFFVKEAYGLYPEEKPEVRKQNVNKLSVKFGLVDNATQTLLPLKDIGNNIFRTQKPIRTGDKFKVAITNSIECYIYVFGQETDGSSYVLFPYTPQHSAYCGITGTRLFPKDYSMTADEKGSKDRIAVIVSKKELNWERLNAQINSSRQREYIDKVQAALGNQVVSNVQFKAGDAVEFSCNLNGKNAVGVVIEMEKI